MGYFVKFKFYQTTTDKEPYKIQKYEVGGESFGELIGLLPLDSGPFTLRYVDSDGDLCSIDNDHTLKVALKGVPASSVLNVRADHKASTSSFIQKVNPQFHKKSRKSLRIEGIKKEVKPNIKEEKPEDDSDVSLGSDDEDSYNESDEDYIDEDETKDDWFEDDSGDNDTEFVPGKENNKRKPKATKGNNSKKPLLRLSKKQPATVEAVPDEASMPDAPAIDPSIGSEAADVSDGTKARIAKLLKTAYSGGNEHEQQQALKLAKRLLEKYNLTQADIEGKFTDEALPGGTAEVRLQTIVKGNPAKEPPKQFERWWDLMAGTVAKNFDVKCYITKRKGVIVFYGLLKNCQTAAFAYSLAFNFTHVNQRNYTVPEGEYEMRRIRRLTQASKGAYTANARRNYTLGVVNGLNQKVEETLREERAAKAKRERKILRLQYKLKTQQQVRKYKEAYNSDSDSDSDSDDTVDLCSDSNDAMDLNTDNDEKYSDHVKDMKPDVAELEAKVLKLEREEKARNALVLHSESVPDRVLKDLKGKEGLKVHKGRTFQRLKEGNQAAWQKGVKDGKEINLNQRAIQNNSGGKQKRQGR